jgi:5'-nucleotidase
MRPKIALFDMDDTLCDYIGSMKRSLDGLRHPDEPAIDPFRIGDDPRYEYLRNRMHLIKKDRGWWANLPKLQLGFDVLDVAKELGYCNEILTKAPKKNPEALAGKLDWLLHNLSDHDFTMTQKKSSYYGRALVDDHIPYVCDWLSYRKNGIAIMPATEYNSGFSHPQVIRYDGSNIMQVRDGLAAALDK